MSDLLRKCTERLRAKTKFWLLDDQEAHIDERLYPFDHDKIPVMCRFGEQETSQPREAYESGNRSIVFHYNDAWFKAKGIGIPRGVSRPIYEKGRIYSYHLNEDLDMCHRSVLWGFMEKHDLDCELFGAEKSKELGISIDPIGFGVYEKILYITFKDRRQLFQYLKETNEGALASRFSRMSEKTSGYCFFARIPSDLRVQELLYTFMFPEVTGVLDEDNSRDYVRWLGSSCGYRLRQLHNQGVLHGTWIGDRRIQIGLSDVHSNSYCGNHIVEEENTGLVDFDLTEVSQDDSLRKLEKWCLIHMENPLLYAGSYLAEEAPGMGLVRKNPFRERLAKEFESGVEQGYDGEIYAIENNIRRNMLDKLSQTKALMWELYGLPKDLVGDIYLIDASVMKRSGKDQELRHVAASMRV